MNDIKIIKTEEKYEGALLEIEGLMLANPPVGAPEGDRLELLSLLVRDYEDKHYPIDPPDPIDAI